MTPNSIPPKGTEPQGAIPFEVLYFSELVGRRVCNGKIRDKIVVPANADEKTVLDMAMKCERVKPWIDGKTIKTAKYVPKKLVTIAVA